MVVIPLARQAGNRFLGSLKGLQLPALAGRYVVPARQAGDRFLGSLKGLQIRSLGVGGSFRLLSYEANIRGERNTVQFTSSLNIRPEACGPGITPRETAWIN